MTQARMRRMRIQAAELVRDFYESLLLLTLALMLQWNQWHVIRILNADRLPEEVTQPQPLSWSAVFFSSGLLLTLLQYRPQWIKRCSLVLRKLLLLLEVLVILFLVDFVLLSMWQPSFNIFEQVLHTLGTSQGNWSTLIYHYCPGLSDWLIHDAFYFGRFIISLSWFLLAFEVSAPKWRLAIDFLVLDQLPEMISVSRNRRRRLQPQS